MYILYTQASISGDVFALRFHHLAENDCLVNMFRARVFVWEMTVYEYVVSLGFRLNFFERVYVLRWFAC